MLMSNVLVLASRAPFDGFLLPYLTVIVHLNASTFAAGYVADGPSTPQRLDKDR